MSNGPRRTPLRFCITCVLCAHRSLRTTLHQPLSHPLWWDSQWRPLSPTTTPKSPLEPPRSPACRLLSDRGLLFQFSTARQMKSASMTSCVSSAPPAAAHGAGGAERNPSWTRGPQIHLWQSGSALPAGCKRPSKSPRVSVASTTKHLHRLYGKEEQFFRTWTTTNVSFSANKKKTWWCCQTPGIPVRQAQRAVGKKWLWFKGGSFTVLTSCTNEKEM